MCERLTDHLCEMCDEPLYGEPVTSEETGPRLFCSEECLQEAQEELRLYAAEAKREWEMFGDDVDSWYR